jgi:hypothetical protein
VLLKGLVAAMAIYIALMLASSVYSFNAYSALNKATLPPTVATLQFSPSTLTVQKGETFTVNIKLTGSNEELWGFEIGVKYDKTLIDYVGVELPSWRFVWGQTESLFWVAGVKPQTGDQTLLTLTFRSKGIGESTLSFYSHKLATIKYWDAPHDYIGWPITHEVMTSIIDTTS